MSLVPIWVFEFYQNLSFFLVLLLLEFFFSFVAIWVVNIWDLSIVTIFFALCHSWNLWVLSQYEFLRYVKISVFEICHNLSLVAIWVFFLKPMTQFEFLSFVMQKILLLKEYIFNVKTHFFFFSKNVENALIRS